MGEDYPTPLGADYPSWGENPPPYSAPRHVLLVKNPRVGGLPDPPKGRFIRPGQKLRPWPDNLGENTPPCNVTCLGYAWTWCMAGISGPWQGWIIRPQEHR